MLIRKAIKAFAVYPMSSVAMAQDLLDPAIAKMKFRGWSQASLRGKALYTPLGHQLVALQETAVKALAIEIEQLDANADDGGLGAEDPLARASSALASAPAMLAPSPPPGGRGCTPWACGVGREWRRF